MRASRFHCVVLFGLMIMATLTACNPPWNASTLLAPTATSAQALRATNVPFKLQSSDTPSEPLPTAFPASDTPPAATEMSGPPTPVPPTPALGPAISHLAVGKKIEITYIHMIDANQGWGIGGLAQSEDHVFRTQDGGKTWRDVTPPQPAPTAGDTVVALGSFTDDSTGWVAYGPPLGSGSVPPYVLVWFTHDGGASWTYGVINRPDVQIISFSPWYLDFADSQHGWLLVFLGGGMQAANVALYSTSDGGALWTDILDTNTESDVHSYAKTGMIFLDAHTGWLTRDAQGVDAAPHTLLTRDGGVTWTRIDLPAPSGATGWFDNNSCGMYSPVAFSTQSALFTMKCLDNATYKVQHDYLYSTGDGGQTWQSVPLPSDFTVSDPPYGGLFFTNAQTGLALGRVIYRTNNGGKSWSLAKLVNWDGQFSFLDLNTGWAVASNAGQIALVKTVDGGGTWQEIMPVVAPFGNNSEIRNIAPLSNLHDQFPGYVDGIFNVQGSGCGGGGGPCLSLQANSQINIIFDRKYQIGKLILYVGCNDGETLSGEILDITGGESKTLTAFNSIGCGDAIKFPETSTDRIAIKMTGGGGGDQQISVEEIEVYGK